MQMQQFHTLHSFIYILDVYIDVFHFIYNE